MNVSLLNTRINVQKNVLTTDEIGNHLNTWEDYYSCYATISGESGSESDRAGQTVPITNIAFTVRYCNKLAGITSDGYRILWRDEVYNITYVDHQNNKRKGLKIWAEKVRR